MNTQLENAIQEAMAELDKMSEKQKTGTEKDCGNSNTVIVESNAPAHPSKTTSKTKNQSSNTKRLSSDQEERGASLVKSVDTAVRGTTVHSSGHKSSPNVSSNQTHFTRLRRSQR